MYSQGNNKQERTHQIAGFPKISTVPHRMLDPRLHRGHGGGRNCTNWCNSTKTKRCQVSSTTDLWLGEYARGVCVAIGTGPDKGLPAPSWMPSGSTSKSTITVITTKSLADCTRLLLSSLFPLGIPELQSYMPICTMLLLLLCRSARKKNA